MTSHADPVLTQAISRPAQACGRGAQAIPLGKRAMDIVLALLLGLLVLPFMLLLLGWLWLREGRPLFYGGKRMSGPGRSFLQWKLRTMDVSTSDDGVTAAHKADRVTANGRWLRRTRVDELPQLWNILKGDMSFVGPRPPLQSYVERFPALYGEVLRIRPGLTGLATVRCLAAEERLLENCRTAEEADRLYVRHCLHRKARLDLLYQRRWSPGLDLWLLALTMRIVWRAIWGQRQL